VTPTDTPLPGRSGGRRGLLLVLGVSALAITAGLLPLESVPSAVSGMGPAAPVAGVLVGVMLLLALVPRTPISVACGLVFGSGLGAVVALAVMMVAAVVTFVLGRRLGRDFLIAVASRRPDGRLARSWARLERWVAREGLLAVATVRAMPLAPYGLVGYAYGASAVRPAHYALGTFIAGTPSAVTYALLGAAVGGAAEASPVTLVPLAFGLTLMGTLALRARRRSRVGDIAISPQPAE
jgi:uncharacterized membrane protein YdjX (TVP38/TMEM64 family)